MHVPFVVVEDGRDVHGFCVRLAPGFEVRLGFEGRIATQGDQSPVRLGDDPSLRQRPRWQAQDGFLAGDRRQVLESPGPGSGRPDPDLQSALLVIPQ